MPSAREFGGSAGARLAITLPRLLSGKLLSHKRPIDEFFHFLANVELDELEELLIDGWRCQAPKALVKEFDARLDRGSR